MRLRAFREIASSYELSSRPVEPDRKSIGDNEDKVADPGPLGMDEVAQLIIQIWDAVSREEMENLGDLVPNRLAAIFQAQGGSNGDSNQV
jgi:hypothetical protein